MKTKTLLVDLDGVLVDRADYFSNRAKEIFPEANHEAIMTFFTGGTYGRAAKGETDLPEAIKPLIEGWRVGVSVEELLKVWFEGENEINHEVLSKIKELREKGVTCVIVTDHATYRKNDVWENLNMKECFDDIIASADFGCTKEETEFFEKSLAKLGIEDKSTVSFIDDDPENVAVASNFGISGVTFEGIDSFDQIS